MGTMSTQYQWTEDPAAGRSKCPLCEYTAPHGKTTSELDRLREAALDHQCGLDGTHFQRMLKLADQGDHNTRDLLEFYGWALEDLLNQGTAMYSAAFGAPEPQMEYRFDPPLPVWSFTARCGDFLVPSIDDLAPSIPPDGMTARQRRQAARLAAGKTRT